MHDTVCVQINRKTWDLLIAQSIIAEITVFVINDYHCTKTKDAAFLFKPSCDQNYCINLFRTLQNILLRLTTIHSNGT